MDCKILLFGGTNFIGRFIVEKCIEKNIGITICNRGTRKNIFSKKISEIYCDRNDKDNLTALLKELNFDYIIDISGLNEKHVDNSYCALKERNIKKYIFLSTSAVYKINNSIKKYKEEDDIGENQYWKEYGLNKIKAEQFLLNKSEENGFPVIIIRPPYVYGEGNTIYRESYIFDRVLENKSIIIPDKGLTQIQFIHIEDLFNIIFYLLNNSLNNKIYNIGHDTVSFLEWVLACQDVVGKRANIIYFDYKMYNYQERDFFPFLNYNNILDVSKMFSFYQPKINLKEGLTRSYRWYQNNSDYIERRGRYIDAEYKIFNTLRYSGN